MVMRGASDLRWRAEVDGVGTRSDLECSILKAVLTGFPDGLMIIITVEIDYDRIR